LMHCKTAMLRLTERIGTPLSMMTSA